MPDFENSKHLIIDGVEYVVPILELKREANILDRTANRTADGNLHRDVIGTFITYTLNIGVVNDQKLYNELFYVFAEPKASHEIILPHDHEKFKAYISSVSDNIVLITDDGYKAKGLTCKFTMVKPFLRANKTKKT